MSIPVNAVNIALSALIPTPTPSLDTSGPSSANSAPIAGLPSATLLTVINDPITVSTTAASAISAPSSENGASVIILSLLANTIVNAISLIQNSSDSLSLSAVPVIPTEASAVDTPSFNPPIPSPAPTPVPFANSSSPTASTTPQNTTPTPPSDIPDATGLSQSNPDSSSVIAISPLAKSIPQDIAQYQNLATVAGNDLNTVQSYVSQLTALAGQAASGSVTDNQRAALNTQFVAIDGQLQNFINNATFNGQPLFNGNFSVNAGTTLGKYIFTGASNQPTAAQATLSLPNLTTLGGLSPITTAAGGASAYNALQTAAQAITAAGQSVSDFSAAVTYANNTLHGWPNNGPSITQVDAINQATTNAKTAQSAISSIASDLSQLQSIATQATSGALTDTARGFLNQEAQQLLYSIDATASQAAQKGVPFDGNFSDNLLPTLSKYLTTGGTNQPTKAQADLQIANLTTGGLFSGQSLDVSTQPDAAAALTAINAAIKTVSAAQSSVKAFNYAINFAKNNGA